MSEVLTRAATRAVLSIFQARALARRNVRNGMDVRDAAWHATMSVGVFTAIGALLLSWLLFVAPLVLTIGTDKGLVVNLARLVLIGTETGLVAAFVVGGCLWTLNDPARLHGWRRIAASPLVLLCELVAFPLSFVGIIVGAGVISGLLP